jgi:putative photosynthetic complex assembly protein 2
VVQWHEIGILLVGVAIVGITWNAPNQVGTGTYLVLWIMRASAKLNLFFGVRNLSEAFLPPHLAYLQSCFRRRAMNTFFPVSVIAATAYLAHLVSSATAPGNTAAQSVGFALVATMLALAVLEHLLLVLPLDATALWHWALSKRTGVQKPPSGTDSAAFSAIKPTPTGGENLDAHDKLFQVP